MNGNVNRFSQAIPVTGIIALAPANYFFLETAGVAVTVKFQGNGQNYSVGGVTAGILVGRVDGWARAVIEGTPGTVVTWYYGDATLREDVTDFRSQLIGGITAVAETPSSAIPDTAAVALPNAATTQIVPANAARKRVTIANPSTALASFFIRQALAGANNLAEIQPGMDKEFKTTAGLWGRNDSGGALTVLVLEES